MSETKAVYKVREEPHTVGQWLCQHCGARLGYVIDTVGVRRLRTPSVFIEGSAWVKCSICGRWRKWYVCSSKDVLI